MAEYNYVRKTARYNGKKFEATGKTEREAYMKLAEKLEAAKRGENTISGDMTVDAWFHKWKTTYKDPKGLTPKSLGMYDEKYNGYIGCVIGKMKLKDVQEVHLQSILNGQAGRSDSHVKKLRMVMRGMFKRARQTRLIQHDPSELLELPATVKGERRSLTEVEREAVLSVAKDHRYGLWIMTLLYTGMRPGESAALVWDDIDFEKNEIHVRTAKESGRKVVKTTKTAAGTRDIPIHSALRQRLLEAKKDGKDFVFPGYSGKIMDDQAIRRRWLAFRRDMDIYMGAKVYRNKITESVIADDLVLYCLRHTFCTDLQDAGVPLNVAKDLMGHADIQTTANIYTHKKSETIHANFALLDSVGGKTGGKIK